MDSYFAIHGDPETNRFNPAGPVASRDAARSALDGMVADWEASGFGYWAVAPKEAQEVVIGFGGVKRKAFADGPGLNLYFRFRPSSWGNGFAAELADATLRFAFDTLSEARVVGVVRANNLPSRKVLERAGLVRVGEIDDVPPRVQSLVYEIRSSAFRSGGVWHP